MQKEPCELMSLCACCQIFQPEMKERNFENTYLKETKEWVSTSQEHWQQCWTDVFLLSELWIAFFLKQHNFGFVLSDSKNFGHRFGSSSDLLGRGPRKNCKNDLDDQT